LDKNGVKEEDKEIMIKGIVIRSFWGSRGAMKKRMNYMNLGRVNQVVKYIYYSK
jgi:hypothetical protein